MARLTCIIGTAVLVACSGLQSPPSISTQPRICAASQAQPLLNGSAASIVCDQTDPVERTVGYVAMAAGLVALVIVFIGFYKLARLVGS